MKTILPLLLCVSFLPLTLHAQSGRKATEPKQTKTERAKTANDEINESKISPDGETVEGDVIRFDTSLVTVPVTVLDRYGRYVPLLRRESFQVFENGLQQKIAYFATTDSPFSVVLLIDTSGSTQFRLDDIQKAAINFVDKLKSTDSVMVMSFDDRIEVLCQATTDRARITKAQTRREIPARTRRQHRRAFLQRRFSVWDSPGVHVDRRRVGPAVQHRLLPFNIRKRGGTEADKGKNY